MSDRSSLDLQQFYPPELKIVNIQETENEIILFMHSLSHQSTCSKCGTVSVKHHGSHHRKAQDLPVLGKKVILDMQVYDYQCPNCSSFSYTETFDGFLRYNSRMTERLEDFICLLALGSSCETCAKTMKMLNVKVSGDTVIRMLLRRYKEQPIPTCSSRIGVDDFAFKKGRTYGTIIVDEATRKTVALLEGRDENTLKEWLQQNKHITVVTRDRASAYAKAIEEILPDCMQIADRFHLHKNLMEAVNKVLGRTIPEIVEVPVEENRDSLLTEEEKSNPRVPLMVKKKFKNLIISSRKQNKTGLI